MEEPSGSVVRIDGDMTFPTVAELYRDIQIHSQGPAITIDLAAAERVDSAGLALLLEWRSQVPRSETFRVINAPQQLLSLARLCEAESLIQIKPREAVQ